MSIVDSEIIVSINIDKEAPIKEISDYVIYEDADKFLTELIKRLKKDKTASSKL